MQAFILAGGFATRLWPLTEKRAKPLLPLAGKPLLTHLVEKIPPGLPITVSTNAVFARDFERWQKESGKWEAGRILIEDAGHESEKLGALGAVAKWIQEEKIADDVLLLAGDNYIGFSLEHFLQTYEGVPHLAASDIGDPEKAKQLGTILVQGKSVVAFEEKSPHPRSTLVSTGCFILPASTLPVVLGFAKKKPDNIGGIFEHFLEGHAPVTCQAYSDPWFDIGSFEAYLEATKALVGENLLDENSAPQRGAPTQTNNVFEGSVVLGKGSRVQKSTLKNVVLFEHCSIEDCILENCILDNGCALRGVDLTGKMLREGTTLVR